MHPVETDDDDDDVTALNSTSKDELYILKDEHEYRFLDS